MDERDAAPVLALGDHLVPEHGAGRGAPELLHVGPAQPARAHADELPVAFRLRDVGRVRLPGGVEDDRFHRRNRRLTSRYTVSRTGL